MKANHLFEGIPANIPEEIFDDLVNTGDVRIERIISKGQASAPDDWYDQEQNEWVILLEGEAVLHFEKSDSKLRLNPGMHINIPAHCRHRVDWTHPEKTSVWLAVFY